MSTREQREQSLQQMKKNYEAIVNAIVTSPKNIDLALYVHRETGALVAGITLEKKFVIAALVSPLDFMNAHDALPIETFLNLPDDQATRTTDRPKRLKLRLVRAADGKKGKLDA